MPRCPIFPGTKSAIALLLGLRATHRLSDVVRDFKCASSEWVHTTLGLAGFAWQDGYGAFTVSGSLREEVAAYIRREEEHHRTRTFLEEYVALLRKSGVASMSAISTKSRTPARGAALCRCGFRGCYPRLMSGHPAGMRALGARDQVKAQYGDDSDEYAGVGRTKKSEVASPTRPAPSPAPAKPAV